MNDVKTLLEETNVISLRTALIQDDGDLVDVRLMPAWVGCSIPGTKPKDLDWVLQDNTWLYRHKRSEADEAKLMHVSPGITQQDVKPLIFERLPELKLIWTDSGNGLAVYLNGEPWAFIDEQTHQGYSKGICKPGPRRVPIGNLWNQNLFERLFGDRQN